MNDKDASSEDSEAFEIKMDGNHPQAGQAFVYQDRRYKFWFYTDLLKVDDVYEVLVKDASSQRFSGGTPKIPKQDSKVIERNIRLYFERFDYYGRAYSPLSDRHVVKFTWDVG
jgi:hypothetical protein